MAEFAVPVVGEAFKSALSHLEREISYLFHFRTNISSLEANVRLLTAKRNDVKRLIQGATMNDEVTREMVEAWLQTVENILGLATKLNGKAAKIDRWFKGWVRFSRFSSSRSGQKMTETVKTLLEYADSFGEKVADERRVQDLVSLAGVLTSNGEFNTFGSRVTAANQVIQALQDDKVSLLGIYGMPGIGKSTMISALPTYVKKHKIFDEVVVVSLTQTPEIKVIQGGIANGLGLKYEDADTLGTRAHRLFARLSHPQKTLIILDNVWQRVELSEVGIPQGLKNCKVVFTTRSHNVCNDMDARKSKIKLEILSPEESWDLFRHKAGDVVDSLAFQSVARDVLNECQGLPLLIVALGRALYEQDKTYWDAALQSLRDSTFAGIPHVFSVMKLSYDNLTSEEHKLCFLFCCLFPDGYHISEDQLFHYIMGENLLSVKTGTFQAARLHLHKLVVEVASSCLLLRAKSGSILMHDVVRDVALAIASKDKGFIVKAGMELNDWPDMQLADCRRLSFITTKGNHMSWRLPNRIQAAHLLTLSFHGNEKVENIPAGFFEEMKSLSTLDLSYTGIKVLPPSIMFLANLRTLLLEGCFCLKDVYLSNIMEKLEILSLRYSAIASFLVSPKITSLKLLDLSYTSKLVHIRQNIISRFLKLEELYMFHSFRAWEPEHREKDASSSKRKDGAEEDEPERPGAISSEATKGRGDSARLSEGRDKVSTLSKGKEVGKESAQLSKKEESQGDSDRFFEGREKVSSLSKGKEVGKESASLSKKEESREDSASLSEVTSLHRLTSLELHVGGLECLFQSIPNWEKLTRFKIAVGVIDNFSPFGIDDATQMEKCMYIELRSKLVANWVKVLLGRTNFLQLRGSQCLIDLVQLDPSPEHQIFRELKVLILREIGPQILSDSSSVQQVSSAAKKVSEMSDSVRFTSLIPCDLLVRLQTLNKLVIMNCKYLEKLIQFEVEGQAVPTYASSSWRVDLVKFSNITASSAFPNLTYLRVCECAELRYLFPMRIIRLLSQLEMLHISNCRRMKMVIVHENTEDVGKADDEKAILPKLRVLSLESLTSLSLIIQQDVHLELPVLEELTVKYCGRLKKLPFGPGSAPQLTKLVVDDDDWFGVLKWDVQNVKQHLLHLLNSLQLKGCRSLKDVELHDQWRPTLRSVRVTDYKGTTLIPCNFLKKMPHLKNLVITNCQELQMINVGEEDETVEEGELLSVGPSSSTSANMNKFSKSRAYAVYANISCLRVSGCSSLKYLCRMRVSRALLQLEQLYIHDCARMEMVIAHEDAEDEDRTILPKLRILSLKGLTSLSRIAQQNVYLDLPAVEELKLIGCKKLELPLSISYGERVLTELEWEVKNQLDGSANRLYLKECTSLKDVELLDLWHPALRGIRVTNYEGVILVHCSLLRKLSNLASLVICDCRKLETVVEFGGEKKAGDTSMGANSSSSVRNNDFSKLSPSLVFPNLTYLEVFGCAKLRYLFPMGVVGDMMQLKVLRINSCSSIETIFSHETAENSGSTYKGKGLLPNLTHLKVVGCKKLKYVLPMRVIRDMAQLTQLLVWSCSSMEMIIEYENVEDGGDAERDRAVLPKLENLSLYYLLKLSSFVGQDILLDWPSLKELTLNGCPDLKKLPLGPASIPRLYYFEALPRSWFDSLYWEDEEQDVKSRLLILLQRNRGLQ